jgi:hypothetical protein
LTFLHPKLRITIIAIEDKNGNKMGIRITILMLQIISEKPRDANAKTI